MKNNSIKTMSWNINGRTGFGGRYQLPVTLLVDTIQMINPDVCVLVEFVKGNGYLDLENVLSEMGYKIFSTKYTKGWNGVAIIVKEELNPSYVEQRIDMEKCDIWPDYLRVDINSDGKQIAIIGTRIRTTPEFINRKEQFDLITKHLNCLDKQFIVLGDFNNANIVNENDKQYESYDKQRKFYNYQMIWRIIEDDNQWSLITPDQGKGCDNSYSIMTKCFGHACPTKDDHMITSVSKENIISAKYDWTFVTPRNGYGKMNEKCVLSTLVGKPDHAILLVETVVD